MNRSRAGLRLLSALLLTLAARTAHGSNPEQPETAQPAGAGTTFLDHSGTGPFWFGAEWNTILQLKPSFDARYSGMNSLRPESEDAMSGLFTLFFAYAPSRTTELILDAEMAYGGGLSAALGLAGFSNLDVVRNPTLSSEPYVARIQIHQIIPLSSDWEPNDDRGPITTLPRLPRHRLQVRFGKLSTVDLFDINPVGSDSHLQFMNWAVDNNGAYDYAADTRGYTYGLVVEYQGPRVEVRFGEMLMPKVANGIDLDFDLSRSHAENFELELKYSRQPHWAGTLRPLIYLNTATMGSYREAIDAFRSGQDPRPEITAHRKRGRTKLGFGLNLFQELGPLFRGFMRIGWNDGDNESFAYTEIDDTFEIGADMRGTLWQRPNDKIGLALVTNGISDLHREYLRLGGAGFLLGDGSLRYGRETIVEHYYNLQIWRGAFAAYDIQGIANPGYNQDRGPVWVFSLRGHLEF
ncbi:MAG TPA: carbohydrate porin [Polyangia bacterium]|nr:carbohydrate porin [Polyangia bacterium]